MSSPRFGILIPCYNASSTISATLKSVQEAIKKTLIEIPVFVYDDCSTDDSMLVASQSWYSGSGFRILKNEHNVGERKTTNIAFNDFREDFNWVFIIHADDMVKEDWLTTLIESINDADTDKYFTVWSSYDSFTENTEKLIRGDNTGNIFQAKRSYDTIKYFLTKVYGSWHISGAAINVSLFHKLNGFDEKMPQFGDTDFFVRGLFAGFMDIYVSRTLTLYRTSERSVSSVSSRTNRDIREIFYLINKFSNVLTKNEMLNMYRIISRLSARRTVKSFIHGNFSLTWINFKYLGKSFLKQISN